MQSIGQTLRSVELFTGAGGLALATHMAGFRHERLLEWNDDACETLRHNAKRRALSGLGGWSNKVIQSDIRDIQFGSFSGVDLVAGGPPCQPFSLGGRHAGMEDKRDMIPHFIRAVRETAPRAFIMENVRGLTREAFSSYFQFSLLQLSYPEIVRKKGECWNTHLARLHQHHTSSPRKSGLSYSVVHHVLNAANFGVPQSRERVFIVGFRSDIDAHWSFPEPTHSQNQLLFDQIVSGDYWRRIGLRKRVVAQISASRLNVIKRDAGIFKPWRTVREAIADLPKPFTNRDDDGTYFNHRLQNGARPYAGHTGSPIDGPSKTLKAGAHGVPGGENMIAFPDGSYRYFTVREAGRIQTFPDTWHFEGAWSEAMRQLGNAVPVELAMVVAKSVAKTLRAEAKN
ncbi:DNA (cytosine-5-)-methyltransferase [Lysobacter sp. HDW10]|uniref:DNA cytosine methyltransferase n=1 Tax=Lysobacter sp. HDW10 TaxID=2714936 RepID=UPI00140857CD|nr:DNA cytosine methyltransferase [Lysobacter sp. HDW10]QIK81507.1 DNA (cytosine-5-)-methyltransferase [Lysobacter sp. HDW10]